MLLRLGVKQLRQNRKLVAIARDLNTLLTTLAAASAAASQLAGGGQAELHGG
jgi:hypothetical protein